MKKYISYFAAVSVLILTSCEKPNLSSDLGWSDLNWGGGININMSSSSFDSSALSYIKLPANRYFIYKDLSSGSIDSVIVTQSTVNIDVKPVSQGYPIGYISNKFELTVANYYSSSTNNILLRGIATTDFPSGLGSTPTHIIDSNFVLSNEQTNVPSFWYPFTSSGLNQYTYIQTLPIQGIMYSAVHCFSSSNGLPSTNINYQASIFYWVKGIGIIKKEIRTYNSVKTSLLLRYG